MPRIQLELGEEIRRLVEAEATAEGVSVDAYIQEAVVRRLSDALQQRRDPDSERRSEHPGGAPVDVAPSAADPSVAPVIEDPERLDALRRTGLLDSPPEETFDRLARLAAEALAAPAAAISLVDDKRQFFKSAVGLPEDLAAVGGSPLSHSVCQYAVGRGEPVVVEDAREDPVLSSNGSVEEGTVVAYIGIPLVDPGGHALGTLCVWDSQPREWTRGHVQILEDLARMTTSRIPTNAGGTSPAV